MANDDVKGLRVEEARQLARVAVVKGDSRCHAIGFCLITRNSEHPLGTVEQHNFKAHPREQHTREAGAATHIESASV